MIKDYEALYLKYKIKYLNLKNGKNIQLGGGENKEVILFRAEWCPHCKNFEQSWNNLSNDLENENTKFVIVEDTDTDLINQYSNEDVKAKGFPTLFVKANGEYFEYMGPMDQDNVKTFIKLM